MKSSSIGLGPMAPQWTTPEHVWRGHTELPIYLVRRAWSRSVRYPRSARLAADSPLNTHPLHQPGNRATGESKTFPTDARPCARRRRASSFRRHVGSRTSRQHHAGREPSNEPDRPASPGDRNRWMGRDLQNPADRLDPVLPSLIVNEPDHHFDRRSSISGSARNDAAAALDHRKIRARLAQNVVRRENSPLTVF